MSTTFALSAVYSIGIWSVLDKSKVTKQIYSYKYKY